MDIKERFSVLFDFDGVVMDTESQYSVFWHQIGVEYLQHDNLEQIIKGQTLTTIFNTYFKGLEDQWETIDEQLKYFEQHMKYEYIDGFEDSFNGLKSGLASGATVVGLATTNKTEDIAPLCHHVLHDYKDFSFDKMIEINERKHS